jgi:flagellar hook-associated protein 1 FlgK
VESSLADQKLVDEMLLGQRQSISGVSLDEEMADLMKYQNAYAASAKLIATIDEMLNDVINLKR